MHIKDIKLNKIYQVGTDYSRGILIPLYIEDDELYTCTIQITGNSNWLFLKDVWNSTDDWDNIREFKNSKTENGEKIDKKYIIDRIFTSKIKFD